MWSSRSKADVDVSMSRVLFVLSAICIYISADLRHWTARGTSDCRSAYTAEIANIGFDDTRGWYLQPDSHTRWIAQSAYIDGSQTKSNFGQLRVRTNQGYSDEQQLYAAGFAEGWLTAHRIYQQVTNTRAYFQSSLNLTDDTPVDWLVNQDAWAHEQAAKHQTDPFWRAMGLVLKQFDGMVHGYLARAQGGDIHTYGNLTRRDLLFNIGNGELYDVMAMPRDDAGRTKFEASEYDGLSPQQMFVKMAGSGRCSALIKVASDLSNIYMAHSSWDTYTNMGIRIYKHYDFALNDSSIPMQGMSFSSYPGELFSDDDFYQMSGNDLVVLQTTNHVFDNSILSNLTYKSAVSWQRVRVANMLATSGRDWSEHLKRENSGTYNNQYMVIDLKKFVPRKALQDDLLWVVEQIPDLVVAADMTVALKLGYWPSFNVPFFPEIYERSAYPDFRNKTSRKGHDWDMPVNWLSQVISPRAMIFRRDQGDVDSMHDMKQLMRSNDYKADKLSEGHALAAICGRGDLEGEDAAPTGCYDTKVTDFHMSLRRESEAVSGPTTAHGMTPFDWATWDKKDKQTFVHLGHPQRFDFEFELQTPVLEKLPCW